MQTELERERKFGPVRFEKRPGLRRRGSGRAASAAAAAAAKNELQDLLRAELLLSTNATKVRWRERERDTAGG